MAVPVDHSFKMKEDERGVGCFSRVKSIIIVVNRAVQWNQEMEIKSKN